MAYLNPPPDPAPVVVVRDYGGLVTDYQAQTAIYRATDREVRLHECHSACTLALSLPNVCVFPDSILKFHQAYNERTRQTDYGVSQQLFESYPPAVRARLGTLTRKFKILTGTELIGLGVRECDAPRVMLASAKPAETSIVPGMLSNVASVFGVHPQSAEQRPVVVAHMRQAVAPDSISTDAPLPPPRPADSQTTIAAETDVPLPPARPLSMSGTVSFTPVPLPRVIAGAQRILPPTFVAYAQIAALTR